MRLLVKAAIPLCVIAISFLVLLYVCQSRLVFVPTLEGSDRRPEANPEGWRNPSERGVVYSDIRLTTAPGVKLQLWLLKQPDATSRPTVVFFHGNAGNLGHRLPNIVQMYQRLKVNVLAVSYRGYGSSSGTPSEKGILNDAEVVIDYLHSREDIARDRIYVFGRSLGGAVAIDVARRQSEKVRGVIVENTFWNVVEMARAIFPPLRLLSWGLRFLIKHPFESGVAIAGIKQPILFFSGDEDEVVPMEQMERLYDVAKMSRLRHFVVINDGTHNDSWSMYPAQYYAQFLKFIEATERGENGSVKVTLGNKKLDCDDKGAQSMMPRFMGIITNEYDKKDL